MGYKYEEDSDEVGSTISKYMGSTVEGEGLVVLGGTQVPVFAAVLFIALAIGST